jgi:hypothetical protein
MPPKGVQVRKIRSTGPDFQTFYAAWEEGAEIRLFCLFERREKSLFPLAKSKRDA